MPPRKKKENTTGAIEVIADKKSIYVKREWVSRWGFLSDLVDEMNPDVVNWSYTDYSTLREWEELNHHMDKGENEKYKLLSLSPMWEVVQFMRPSNGDYLLYCLIDDDFPFSTRRELYRELGQYIRRGQRYPYSTSTGADILTIDLPGLYYNFYLWDDPVYNKTLMEGIKEELRNLVYSPSTRSRVSCTRLTIDSWQVIE